MAQDVGIPGAVLMERIKCGTAHRKHSVKFPLGKASSDLCGFYYISRQTDTVASLSSRPRMPDNVSYRAFGGRQDLGGKISFGSIPPSAVKWPTQWPQQGLSHQQLAYCETNEQLIDLWLHGKSPCSEKAYRRDLSYFLAIVGNKPLNLVTLNDVQGFADALERKHYAAATVSRRLSAVKSILSFGHKIGVLPVNSGLPVVLPKVEDNLVERILTESQVLTMIAMEPNQRNKAMLRFLYATGVRVEELIQLTWRDLKPSCTGGGQVKVFGKGGATRVIAFSGETWELVKDLREDAGLDEPVFQSRKRTSGGHLTPKQVFRVVRSAARRVGIDDVSPHWLRHCHGSHAAERGVPLPLIARTLGHKSLATTSRYLHARPQDSSGLHLPV